MWFIPHYLRSGRISQKSELSNYMLSKSTEVRSEQPLASAYVLHLYKLHELHISCCGNHLSQRQMITQTVNLLVGYQVGNSQENLTRSLC